MKRLFAMILTLGLMASVAYAHNGMEHVMGTVVAISDSSISVKTQDGKTQTVPTTTTTKYTQMDKPIALNQIKIGDHVVIEAAEKEAKLVAVTVKVGMAGMKGMSGDMGGMKMDHASPQHK